MNGFSKTLYLFLFHPKRALEELEGVGVITALPLLFVLGGVFAFEAGGKVSASGLFLVELFFILVLSLAVTWSLFCFLCTLFSGWLGDSGKLDNYLGGSLYTLSPFLFLPFGGFYTRTGLPFYWLFLALWSLSLFLGVLNKAYGLNWRKTTVVTLLSIGYFPFLIFLLPLLVVSILLVTFSWLM